MAHKEIIKFMFILSCIITTQSIQAMGAIKRVISSPTVIMAAAGFAMYQGFNWALPIVEKTVQAELEKKSIQKLREEREACLGFSSSDRQKLNNFFLKNECPPPFIILKNDKSYCYALSFGKLFILGLSEGALQLFHSGDKKKQEEFYQILAHEAEHVTKEHSKKQLLLQLAIPSTLMGVCELVQAFGGSRNKALVAMIAAGGLIYTGYMQQSQYDELHCDLQIPRNVLRGKGVFHPTNEQLLKEIENLSRLLEPSLHDEKKLSPLKKIRMKLWNTHPLTSDELKALNDMAVALRTDAKVHNNKEHYDKI